MTDRRDYFDNARSWADDTRALAARSRRTAWLVAGIAVAIAAFEAVALAMLTPLKTIQPLTLLVDRQTGYVQALDPLSPRRVTADEALTRSLLAQYVTAREGYDRATVAADYRRVALWSAGRPRQSYIQSMPVTNPESPLNRYAAGTLLHARVKSISRLEQGLAMVRFDTQIDRANGSVEVPQPWVAVVRFRFVDAPMSFEDRLINPLGFQVTGYRRDAEAPPPPQVLQVERAPASAISDPAAASAPTSRPAPYRSSISSPIRRVSPDAVGGQRSTPRVRYARPPERREVPINNIPLGSPLGLATPPGVPVNRVAQ